ncbi:MAG: nuclear transport factor 2 family protein [Cyanobacteria bacterium P01_A01_bin.83]
MTYIDTQQSITIEGVEQSVILDYFTSINQEEFTRTAALFAEEGELQAPFEKPIIGRSAIASYLSQEAAGMKLLPQAGTVTQAEAVTEINVTGKTKTVLFTVNVGWYFTLNTKEKITKVRIKLLASPQELLGLRNIKNAANT